MTAKDAVPHVNAHRQKLEELWGENIDFYASVLPDLHQLFAPTTSTTTKEEEDDDDDSKQSNSFTSVQVDVFDDENSKSGLVYALGTNR